MNSVLIIMENSSIPGDPRVWNEARALQQNGYQVTILCPRSKKSGKGYEFIDGIHVYRHPMPAPMPGKLGYIVEYGSALLLEFVYALWIWFRRGFKVIQGCNPPDDIVLVALPFKLFGVKYIFDHHDASLELYEAKFSEKGLLFKILALLENLTYRFSNAIIVTNHSYKKLALTRGRRKAEDVFVVRNGPDPEHFRTVPPKPELKYGKEHLVGYIGHMDVQDGLDILVQVAAYVKKIGRSDVHFTCIGGGPSLSVLRQMVQDQDVADMMNFTGWITVEQILDILSTADVCVNPDRPCAMNDISTMIKIMEYMALGKPIVQFECIEGRFSAGEASLYANPSEMIADFANKILWLLDHPDERKRMGEFGRRRVETELAWNFSVPHLLAAYEHVLC